MNDFDSQNMHFGNLRAGQAIESISFIAFATRTHCGCSSSKCSSSVSLELLICLTFMFWGILSCYILWCESVARRVSEGMNDSFGKLWSWFLFMKGFLWWKIALYSKCMFFFLYNERLFIVIDDSMKNIHRNFPCNLTLY